MLWVLVHTVYRMRVDGRENIPAKGGALLVSNHLSFVDALVLMASIDRPVRFLIFKDFYDHPLIHPFAVMGGGIPISSELRPREMIRSLRTAGEAIAAGEVVCIFAEGQMTRIGQLLPFRRGLEFIVKGVDAPIIPVQLGGVWGSIFSYENGKYFWKLPKRLLQPVTVSFGKPMPSTSSAFEVRQAVEELQTEAYRHQKDYMQTLPQRVRDDGAPESVSICHGGWPETDSLWRRTHSHDISRKAVENASGRTGKTEKTWWGFSCRLPSPARW